MELTIPRSPTISRAMAAYVVSEVTTFTGAGGMGPPARPSTRAMKVNMSVGLVFVGADRPDGLEGELVSGVGERSLLVCVLGSEKHPFAFPPRQRGDPPAGDAARARILHVVECGAEDHALVQLVGGADVAAHAGRADTGDPLSERQQLPPQRPF